MKELAVRAFEVADENAARRANSRLGHDEEAVQVPSLDQYPNVVEIVVGIPRRSRNKYEWDEEAGVLRLDRVFSSSVFYNFDSDRILRSGSRSEIRAR